MVAESVAEMEKLRPLWERLHACSPGATMFQSFGLSLLAARTLGQQPSVVACESDSGAALIPAARGTQGLTLLGEEMFDYRAVLHCGDAAALAAAWRKLAEFRQPLRFCGLRNPGDEWNRLTPVPWVGAPILEAAHSSEDWEQAHPRMASRLRKLQRCGARLVVRSGAESALIWWLLRQKAIQCADAPNNIFAEAKRIVFMAEWCAQPAAQCEVFCLEIGPEVLAAVITFRDEERGRPVRRFYTTHFNPKWTKYSPGMALLFAVTRNTVVHGLDADLMTGEQPYKLRLASQSVPLYRMDASPEALLAVADAMHAELPAVA